MRGSTSSLRNEARTFQVDRMWCDRLLAAAAQLGRSRHNAAFRDLIESVGGCRPVAFFLQRAYDETGRVCRTQSMMPDGELVTTLETAKLMSGMLTFAIVAEQAGVLHVIKGTLPTLIVPMSNQTAPVVAQCLSRFFNAAEHVDSICRVFPSVTVLRCSDLHRSYPCGERVVHEEWQQKAEGTLKPLKPLISTCHFRCSLHRVATAEKSILTLDPDIVQAERFLLTFTLMLRGTDCLRAFRMRLRAWCVGPDVLEVHHGSPPAEVQAWRKSVEPLLFPGPPQDGAEVRRRLCWDLLVNGDARKRGVIEHWCAGATCCPGGRADLVKKLLGPCGIMGLLSPPPDVFPRKSWAGQAEVESHVLLLELCGGAVSRNFHSLVKQAESRAAKAAHRVRVAEAAVPGDDESSLVAQANKNAERALNESADCQSAWNFLSGEESLRRLLVMRGILEPFRKLKAIIMRRNGAAWELEQQMLALDGHVRQHRVSLAANRREIRATMNSLTVCMNAEPAYLSGTPGSGPASNFSRWRLGARAGGALQRVMFDELSPYPWRFFDLLLSGKREGADFLSWKPNLALSNASWMTCPGRTRRLIPPLPISCLQRVAPRSWPQLCFCLTILRSLSGSMPLAAAARTFTSRPMQIRSRPAVLVRCSSCYGRPRLCRRRSGDVATSLIAHHEKDMTDVEHRPAQQRRESSALATWAGARNVAK